MINTFKKLKDRGALVHNITNYVTVNDCANILLAAGASPLMADDKDEVEEIVSISSALYINIGTLNKRTIESMVIAGKHANKVGIPVVLDPVGMGASALRNKAVEKLIEEVDFTVVKGNMSEIKGLFSKSKNTGGVDVKDEDIVHENSIEEAGKFAMKVADTMKTIVVITGKVDIIASSSEVAYVKNGHAIMSRITGTGCMLGSLIAAYCGANTEECFSGACTAVAHMGLAGEIAADLVQENGEGTGSFRTRLIDWIYLIDEKRMKEDTKIEVCK